ncbi:MAG: glycosyltransferase family 2 protein, partial [Sphingomicrobium sp.]
VVQMDKADRAQQLVCSRRCSDAARTVGTDAIFPQALSRHSLSSCPGGIAPPSPRRQIATQLSAPMRISAIVITRNEAGNIGPCLDSVAFCDERIVVDSGSDDGTVELARAKGAEVTHHAWHGFGAQKNFALSLAKRDWVLSIDADERVTPALAAAIENAIAANEADGYEMPRSSSFCGRVMRHSGWHPDYVLRLFRRGKGRFTDDLVHERVICDGQVARLSEPLIHHPVLRLEDAVSRMDRYSTAGAEKLLASGRRVYFISGIARGIWAFLRAYVLRAGFLDGAEGFLLAVANAEGTYYRYMKAWIAKRRRD